MADGSKAKPTYTPLPAVPEQLQERYQVLLEVLSGRETVSGGARRLRLSRNHFQSLLHRGLEGLLEGLSPKAPGRPPKPERQAELESEVERLRRQNETLQSRVDTVDRLLGVASEMVRGRIQPTPKSRRSKASPAEGSSNDNEEPDGEARRQLAGVEAMKALGLSTLLATAVAGVSESTVRRWRKRSRLGVSLVKHRGPEAPRPVGRRLLSQVEGWVRGLRGLVGAECLQHLVPGVSRRVAAEVKRRTLTAMERERVQAAERIVFTQAGVVRGFDAVLVRTPHGVAYVLPSADAAVPYRTSVAVASKYDGHAVAWALEEDIRQHGAPLVWRVDRAAVHGCPRVREVLDAHGILVLHGPPHHPRYYGQLERMNREHRAWLDAAGPLEQERLQNEVERMALALNAALPRRSLGWRTAQELWQARPVLMVDRSAFRDEVKERTRRLGLTQPKPPAYDGLIERLAIEMALADHGWLKRQRGGWC